MILFVFLHVPPVLTEASAQSDELICFPAAGTTGWTLSTWTQASCQTHILTGKPFSEVSSPGAFDVFKYFASILLLSPLTHLCRLHHSRIVSMFATGEGILTQEDGVTADGLQEVFTTNLFGHFLLVSGDESCKILLNAENKVFCQEGQNCTSLHLIRQIQVALSPGNGQH